MLVGERKLTHSYPHCWRCHNPVIFRATEQWFIELDHDNLRQNALAEIAKVKWKPEWGEERIHDMVAERPDWCISRQRFWGVPLIIFYCDACGKQLRDYPGAAPRAAIFRARRRGRVVHAFRRRTSAAGNEVLVRRGEMAQGNATFWTCGSIPARRISRCSAKRTARGLPTCISKAPTNIAAGSTVRCWWPWAFAAARRTRKW